jgi:hypothetical protein
LSRATSVETVDAFGARGGMTFRRRFKKLLKGSKATYKKIRLMCAKHKEKQQKHLLFSNIHQRGERRSSAISAMHFGGIRPPNVRFCSRFSFMFLFF